MTDIYIHVNGRWLGPVQNPQIRADGWLAYGVAGQGRVRPENWKNAPLEPAPRLGSRKARSISRPHAHPALIRPDTERCFCVRCGGYFRGEAAFSAHQIKVGHCADSERALRQAGLKIRKTHEIDGQQFIEWRTA